MADIDAVFLINLVHEKAVLWDATHEYYKDRKSTKNAWSDIFISLNPFYSEFTEDEKTEFGKPYTCHFCILGVYRAHL